MNHRARDRWSFSAARIATLAAACAAGVATASDGSAAPPLRTFDPKTGLPQTWDSRIGVMPPPTNARHAVQLPGAVVDPCHHYDKTSCADPTFATKCPNAAQACSAYKELDACAANPPAGQTCAAAYYQNHKAQMEAVPKVRRIEPSRNSQATQS